MNDNDTDDRWRRHARSAFAAAAKSAGDEGAEVGPFALADAVELLEATRAREAALRELVEATAEGFTEGADRASLLRIGQAMMQGAAVLGGSLVHGPRGWTMAAPMRHLFEPGPHGYDEAEPVIAQTTRGAPHED